RRVLVRAGVIIVAVHRLHGVGVGAAPPAVGGANRHFFFWALGRRLAPRYMAASSAEDIASRWKWPHISMKSRGPFTCAAQVTKRRASSGCPWKRAMASCLISIIASSSPLLGRLR